MDPLTHTLVGASLAATGLRERTRAAVPALIVGANLPDIDVLAYAAGADAALGFRRGWTHGVAALVVLPGLLAAGLWLWNRRRRSDPAARPLSIPWLWGLCSLAAASHPFLDWLNTYGMRWWMPFRDTWYYGDAVFIMDPWLWLVLGTGWLVGREPTRALTVTWGVLTATLLLIAAGRLPAYVPLVVAIAVVLLAALLWRPGNPVRVARRCAASALVLASLYVAAMITLHRFTEDRVRAALEDRAIAPIEELMVGPAPANPLVWDLVARQGDRYRYGRFTWGPTGSLVLSGATLTSAQSTALWTEILDSGRARGFLRWVRFPWLELETRADGRLVFLMDARYARQRTLGFGGTTITLPVDDGDAPTTLAGGP